MTTIAGPAAPKGILDTRVILIGRINASDLVKSSIFFNYDNILLNSKLYIQDDISPSCERNAPIFESKLLKSDLYFL